MATAEEGGGVVCLRVQQLFNDSLLFRLISMALKGATSAPWYSLVSAHLASSARQGESSHALPRTLPHLHSRERATLKTRGGLEETRREGAADSTSTDGGI
jgi:hypothetical protein